VPWAVARRAVEGQERQAGPRGDAAPDSPPLRNAMGSRWQATRASVLPLLRFLFLGFRYCAAVPCNFSSTAGSSSVLVSPLIACPAAICRKNRRMILPLRVLGSISAT
jgi:hypothetical protein